MAPNISACRFLRAVEERGARLTSTEIGSISYRAPKDVISGFEKSFIQAHRNLLHLLIRMQEIGKKPLLVTTSGEPVPSLQQELCWAAQNDFPEGLPFENLKFVMPLTTGDPEIVQTAIRNILLSNAVLRYSFFEERGKLRVKLNAANEFQIEHVQADQLAEAVELAAQFMRARISMSNSWLAAAKLIGTAPRGALLALRFHCSVFDGASQAIVTRAILMDIESIEKRSHDISTPKRLFSFDDFAKWEKRWFLSPSGESVDKYWSLWIKQMSPLKTPSGRTVQWCAGKMGYLRLLLAPALTMAIELAAQNLSVSLPTLLAAVFALALSRWSGESHFAIRLVRDGRMTLELAQVVGLISIYDPIEIIVDGKSDMRTFVHAIREEADFARQWWFPNHNLDTGTNQAQFRNQIAATFNFLQEKKSAENVRAIDENSKNFELTAIHPDGPEWKVELPPIYLACQCVAGQLMGSFTFNDAAIADDEQRNLASAFVEVASRIAADSDMLVKNV